MGMDKVVKARIQAWGCPTLRDQKGKKGITRRNGERMAIKVGGRVGGVIS